MRACSTASGGVMFIPDTIERGTVKAGRKNAVSYIELTEQVGPAKEKRRPLTQRIFEKLGFKRAA